MRCHATKVDCVFVFDGATDQDKLRCRFDRLCKQSANVDFALSKIPLQQHSNLVADKDFHSAMKIQSTPPLLAISCIISAIGSLRTTQTRAFYAKGEADKTIVEAAVALNATAIMSNDSDMLIYDTANVGFIPFWGFGFADDGSLNAFIIRRRKLSNLLGILESSLPILAALVGNDFTSAETCYHMHKILFEGSKTTNSSRSGSNVSLDKLDQFHSIVGLEITELSEEKIQRHISKPKMRRGDSNLSASDRMKSRRRANKVEEESKRKANHIKSAESGVCSRAVQMKQSDTSSESSEVLSSSLINDVAWTYGESGVKTVKAAAAFLRKAEVAHRSTGGGLPSVSVTAHLLGLSEDEVLSHLALGSSPDDLSDDRNSETQLKGLCKISNLCAAFFSAFEDSKSRYGIAHACCNGHDNPAVATRLSSSNQLQSELRCCYRCSSCSPRCSELHSGALAGLLLEPDPSQSHSLGVLPHDNSASASDITAICRSLGRGVKLSPDMDQVLSSRTFIGRTPCSLYCPPPLPLPHRSVLNSEQQEGHQIEACTVNGGDSAPYALEPHLVGDYVLLQPLRRRLYSALFQENLTAQPDGATDQLSVLEVFKKNNSPHLERRVVVFSSIAVEMAALESKGALDASVFISQEAHEDSLMKSAAFLVLWDSAPLLLLFFFSTNSLHQLSGLYRRPRLVRNQFFFSLVTAHLFLNISAARSQMQIHSDSASGDTLGDMSSIVAAAAYLVSSTLALTIAESESAGCTSSVTSRTADPSTFSKSNSGSCQTDAQDDVTVKSLSSKAGQVSEGLTLIEINMWTRLQLCVQHVNFSVEMAAQGKKGISSMNEFLGHDSGQKIQILESTNESEVDGVLQLLLGGDVGLMDPELFFHVSSLLQRPLSQFALASKMSGSGAAAASSLLLTSLRHILESLLPPHIEFHRLETLHSAITMMVPTNIL